MTTKVLSGYFVRYERQNQYRIYDPARQAVFVTRDVIFDATSIGPKSDSPSIDPTVTSDSEVALGFPTFCFPYIPWVDNLKTSSMSPSPNVLSDSQLKHVDTPALPLTQNVATPNPTSQSPAFPNLPKFNSDTHKDNQTILFDSENELSLPRLSFRECLAP